MNIFERPRWAVFTQRQHPYRHDLTEFFYSNPAVPLPVNNTKEALDYLFGVIYPNYIGTYDTPADLPVTANANDYAVVTDDGDGKSAGYVWLVLNGVAGWNKKYDVDWSMEAILAEAVNRTMYMYVHKYGLSDKDAGGSTVTGLYGGQSIYGGDTLGQNLTLFPNSGNTLGGYSGYVQFEGDARPTVDDEFTLGTAANKWADLRTVLATIGDISIAAGSIAAAGGAISFGSNDLSTTGDIEGDDVTGSRLLASVGANVLTITPSSVESSTGAISFGANDLSTTGDLAAMTLLLTESTSTLSLDPLSAGAALIVSSTGTINFGTNALGGISSLTATGAATAASGTFGDIAVGVTSRKIATTAGNLLIGAFANVVFEDNDVVFDSVAGFLYDRSATNLDGSGITARFANLTFASATLASTAGNILLDPASAVLQVDGDTRPLTDAARSLGAAGARWVDLYLSGSIGNGTDAVSIGTLVSFRDANVSVNVGDALFWDGTKWAPSSPDTEIDHSSLSGLTTGDAGHTQFALLAGRAGGQTLIGGTAASNNLTLQSTSNATRGSVLFADPAAPSSDDATDFGLSGNRWKDLYTSGQFYGARLENRTSDPSFSAANVGRLIFRTDLGVVKIDTGSAWINVGTIALTTVGGTSNVNGATVSLGVLQLHPADGTYPGVMTASTQTIGGAKTWTENQNYQKILEYDSVASPAETGAAQTLALPGKMVAVLADNTLTSIAGITAPGNVRIYHFVNSSGSSITWLNASGSASVGNRINTGGANFVQLTGTVVSVVYDTANAVWVLHNAGLLPVSRGGTGLTSGTSGGVLGFTASGTIASSAALAAGQVVLGGGAGATPTTLAAGTSGQYLKSNGSSAASWQSFTNPTVQRFTSGSGTYTTPAGVRWIRVTMVGGGGGGGSSGTASFGASTGGTDTTFGSNTARAGNGGGQSGSAAGGTVTIGTATYTLKASTGAYGTGGQYTSTVEAQHSGGVGGSTPLGGGGAGGAYNNAGVSAEPNTGAGGGGAGVAAFIGAYSAGGGGAGGYIQVIINNPAASYSYGVGSGGSGGSAGTNGQAGGNGGSGVIIVEEFYQ